MTDYGARPNPDLDDIPLLELRTELEQSEAAAYAALHGAVQAVLTGIEQSGDLSLQPLRRRLEQAWQAFSQGEG
jgi:hypothetical protein